MGKRNKFCETFKHTDIYGEPVSVNFRGEGNYKTHYGAFISILTILFIGSYFGLQLNTLVN